ncbi:something about silencing protein 10 [Lithohypha guttulata]|uniref:Something about silencing protein 10 n=1 Tax=Lithohypha guttulata TaxID=1690604 RepID=A0AAN7SXX6_9EURO|nr:something about silencing protein 10 [Lithohypha guttulata]
MAKKRKAPRTFEQSQPVKSAKYDVEETFDDSEDEFYAGRDKILLDDDANKRRRQRVLDQEKDLQPSDEEVLAYQDDSDDFEDEDEDIYDDEVETDQSRLKNGSRQQARGQDEGEELSDEEHWGTNRADYYGDDVIETEEQAKEEENEAKRLHQKQLKNMTEADFGFDENEWIEEKKPGKQGRAVTEKLPDAQIPQGATEDQKLQILSARYPEFVPLAEDFLHLSKTKQELDEQSKSVVQGISHGARLSDGLPISLKLDALSTYLATISMYFAIVTSATSKDTASSGKITAMAPLDLHEHPIIQSLARARQLWNQVEPLQVQQVLTVPQQLATPESEEHPDDLAAYPSSQAKLPSGTKLRKEPAQKSEKRKPKAESKKVKDELVSTSTKKKQKKPRDKDKPKLLDLNTLIDEAQDYDEESDFGDEQPLTEEQFAEKARKRKSLRFYTSQLASKANKRGNASRVAGGDDDLPYKERQKDKQERLIREAENRGRGAADHFDDGDNDYDDMPANRDANDEYYDTLLNAKQKKQSDKKARAEAYAQAAKDGATVYEEETVGADAKNKGLAPKRKKEVRNPRVKKRMKFDEKMKKLGSIRQVYKGGEGRGGYGGELTGIKTNVVKSVKL